MLSPLLPSAQAESNPRNIEELGTWRLQPGQTRTLPVVALERFSVSGQAFRVSPLPDSPHALLIKATQAGQGELWIWTGPMGPLLHLSVLVSNTYKDLPSDLFREVRTLQSGKTMILSGQIQTEAELLRVRSLVESHPSDLEVRDQTELSPELLDLGRRRVENWLEAQLPRPPLHLVESAGQLFVRGSAPNAILRSAWEQKLRSLFAGIRLEITTLSQPEQTLFFRVILMELKKRAFQSLGLQWPSQLTSSVFQQIPQFEIQSLEKNGTARVLSRPELVVRIPGEAELFSGGEIPIELRTVRGPHVEWKSYGLILKLKALELSGDVVRLEISSEVSDLDRANGGVNVPALQASRIKTQVDARIGAPLLLSGLLQERRATNREGLSGLSSIPLLGRLFGVKATSEEQSELVAMLLPLRDLPKVEPTIQTEAKPQPQIERTQERDYLLPRLVAKEGL